MGIDMLVQENMVIKTVEWRKIFLGFLLFMHLNLRNYPRINMYYLYD